MSSLQLSLLLFSVTVRYQTSSTHLHPVSQKLAHSKPTNKTEYSIYFIFLPSPIIGLTEIFSIFISILFKFENSSREIDTAKGITLFNEQDRKEQVETAGR